MFLGNAKSNFALLFKYWGTIADNRAAAQAVALLCPATEFPRSPFALKCLVKTAPAVNDLHIKSLRFAGLPLTPCWQ
jgi:hypothetical protein